MRQDQLEHAIRTACQIIGRHEVIVVGSQSILGTFREDQLPADATRSVEIDILPIADDNTETARLADLIEGVAGEFSPFEELHGFSIDGVDLSTSALPTSWRSRLVKVQNGNTAAPDGEPQYTGWCLDKEDLCGVGSGYFCLCGAAFRRGGAVLARVTSDVVSSTRLLDGSIRPPSASSTVRVAMAAMLARGWTIVVSGGETQADIGRSSKPTTLRSSGIRSLRSRAASYTPIACMSLPAKIAVGGSASPSMSRAAASAPSKRKSPA